MDTEIQGYLQELANHCSYPDAAVALGYARRSYHTVKDLYATYGVVPPNRCNGYVAEPLGTSDEIDELRSRAVVTPLSRGSRRQLKVERAIVISDLHIPFHDTRAIAVVLAIIEDLQPDHIFLGGDVVDFYALSRFDKDPRRALMLQDELDQAVDVLSLIRDAAPEAKIVYVEGNHEVRLRAFLNGRAPELSGLRVLTLESLLRLDELAVEFVPMKGKTAYARFGGIKIGHFDRVNKQSAYTAKLLMDDYACDLLQGHTHRLGTHLRKTADEPMKMAGETGCLCQLDPEYVESPNWHHGVTVITKRTETGRYHLTQIPIVDYEVLLNETLYAA